MKEEELTQEKFLTLIKIVSEITEMQHQLNEQVKINGDLEQELARLKRMDEESRGVVATLREQLADSSTEKEVLASELEHETKERKRIEEEFHTVRTSLEEQLARREAEMELTTKNLNHEIQMRKQALDKLQQSINELYEF